ncbi:MAG: hypothetical protein ACRENQ_04670 [Gemmatimonadaceae bacterium]
MRRRASPLSYIRGLTTALAFAATPASTRAQGPVVPYGDWQTLETAHFRFHYPAEFAGWTRQTASHMEAVDSAVRALVGFAPTHRVDVVVDDPYDQPNGSALPFIRSPVLTFWPVPPTPRDNIGNWRTWGEILSVHEFTHLAHLTRPSRNPLDALVWRLLPVDLGPLPRRVPRWAIEGYATFVEGRVTGSGRPNGAWRAAVLRQWALEGHLPTYDQMSAWGAFEGGDFAYLAGSAFLEWLVARQGDSSLVHVWRRASARVPRTFDDAFAGVYGDSPRVLYGRFTAQLTAQATDAERALAHAGLVEGTLIEHLDWQTGDPALSPDGRRVAVVRRSGAAPSRLVVWSTAAPPPDTAAERRTRAMLARDPEDVAATPFYPPPRRALATLEAVAGRGFVQPRFLPDGRHVLVNRLTRQTNGTLRSDLYLWDIGSGRVYRLTVDAGVRDADPSPDGRDALGSRCVGGACNVVRVNLRTGAVIPVLLGTPSRSYYRPRYAPDGLRFVVSASDGGRWRLAISQVDGTGFHFIDPEDAANRFDASFRPSGDTLVYASDRGGVIDLAQLDLATRREQSLTRVTGAAVAPVVDPTDGSIWFLSLHARGYDVRRLRADTIAGHVVSLAGAYGAAAPPVPITRPPLPTGDVSGPRPYGLEPRHGRWLPGESFGPDGLATAAYVTNIDVIGRLDAIAGGAWGARPQWNGGTLGLAWRGSRVEFDAAAHWARRQPSFGSVAGSTGADYDATRRGGLVAATWSATGDAWSSRARVGAGYERLTLGALATPRSRTLGFVEWGGSALQSRGLRAVSERLTVHSDGGRTGSDHVARVVVGGTLGMAGIGPFPLLAQGTWGRMSGSSLAFERFAAGGMPSPLVDPSLTEARYAVPGLPNGAVLPADPGTTSSLFAYRLSIPMGMLSPSYEAVSVSSGASPDGWHRVAGLQLALVGGTIPAAYLPGFKLLIGVSRSFDAPFRRRMTVYSEVRVIP